MFGTLSKACCYNVPKVECNHKPIKSNNKLLCLSDGVSKVCACLGMLLPPFQALKRLLISHMELQVRWHDTRANAPSWGRALASAGVVSYAGNH